APVGAASAAVVPVGHASACRPTESRKIWQKNSSNPPNHRHPRSPPRQPPLARLPPPKQPRLSPALPSAAPRAQAAASTAAVAEVVAAAVDEIGRASCRERGG